jgi:hypothetical protein
VGYRGSSQQQRLVLDISCIGREKASVIAEQTNNDDEKQKYDNGDDNSSGDVEI